MAKKEPAALAKVVKDIKDQTVKKSQSNQGAPSKTPTVTSSVVHPGPATQLLQNLFGEDQIATVSAAKAAVDKVLQNNGGKPVPTVPKTQPVPQLKPNTPLQQIGHAPKTQARQVPVARTIAQSSSTTPSSKPSFRQKRSAIQPSAMAVPPNVTQGTSAEASSLQSVVMLQLLANPSTAMVSLLQNTVGKSTSLMSASTVPPTLAQPVTGPLTLAGTAMPTAAFPATSLVAPTSLSKNVLSSLPKPYLPSMPPGPGIAFSSPVQQQTVNTNPMPTVIQPSPMQNSTPTISRAIPQVCNSLVFPFTNTISSFSQVSVPSVLHGF